MARMRRDRDENDERDDLEDEDGDLDDEDGDLDDEDDVFDEDDEDENDRMSARVRKSVGSQRAGSSRSSRCEEEDDDGNIAFTEIDADEFMQAHAAETRRAVRKSVQPLEQSVYRIQRRLDRLTKSLGDLAEQMEEMGEVHARIEKALADLPEMHKLVKSLREQADTLAKSVPVGRQRETVQTPASDVMEKGTVGEPGGEQAVNAGGIPAEKVGEVGELLMKAIDLEPRLGTRIVTQAEYRAFQTGKLTMEQAEDIRKRLSDAQARMNGVAA